MSVGVAACALEATRSAASNALNNVLLTRAIAGAEDVVQIRVILFPPDAALSLALRPLWLGAGTPP
jgi:hypothetical protein